MKINLFFETIVTQTNPVFLKFESYYCNFQGDKVFIESYIMDQLQKCYRNIHINLLKVFISYDFLVNIESEYTTMQSGDICSDENT